MVFILMMIGMYYYVQPQKGTKSTKRSIHLLCLMCLFVAEQQSQ